MKVCSALAGFETRVLLVDDVDAALAADHAASLVPGLHGLERVDDLHGWNPGRGLFNERRNLVTGPFPVNPGFLRPGFLRPLSANTGNRITRCGGGGRR